MQPFGAPFTRPSIPLFVGMQGVFASADWWSMAPLVPLSTLPRALAATLLAAALALILSLALSPAAHAAGNPCATASIAAVSQPASRAGEAIRCLVNQQRAAHGLRPLRANRPLRIAAVRHGADMVAHRFFAHVSPFAGAITSRARRAGYIHRGQNWALGEDIAWGEASLSSPGAIVEAWMNSPAHRAVILNGEYREAGVGIVPGIPLDGSGLPGATFVLDVGAR
jgi:uncharacterized protein YkwD